MAVHCVPCCEPDVATYFAAMTSPRTTSLVEKSITFVQQPAWVCIGKVKMCLQTGEWEFEDGYDPVEEARKFLSCVSHEYNEFLEWKKSRG